MRIALVNPPKSEFDVSELGPPLGLLRLAGTARRLGWRAEIFDFNLLWHCIPRLRQDFYSQATELLLFRDADVYGFTSMAVDSHVAVELARRIKAARPNVKILFGGTHFSPIAQAIVQAYPWVDGVIQGEGETILREFICSGARAGELESWDDDYLAVDLDPYFSINPRRTIDMESARGCRFKCTFCYSPVHYPQRRMLDLSVLVRELDGLSKRAVKHFFLVDDNFLNDEERAIRVCGALSEAGLDLTWHCYATLPQLGPRVVEAMARADCTAVFTGIDAVGGGSQRSYGKRFMSSFETAAEKIRLCLDSGIVPTCAFLVAPPSHPCGPDAEETVRAALGARILGANIRLNMLTYYPGTRLQAASGVAFEHDDYRVRVGLDAPSVVVENEYAINSPDLFPFHARYVSAAEWQLFTQQIHCLFTLLYARTDELQDRIREDDSIRFFPIADQVLGETGDLLLIDKEERRRSEVEAFDHTSMRELIPA